MTEHEKDFGAQEWVQALNQLVQDQQYRPDDATRRAYWDLLNAAYEQKVQEKQSQSYDISDPREQDVCSIFDTDFLAANRHANTTLSDIDEPVDCSLL